MQPLAAGVTAARRPVAADNPFLALQTKVSEQITTGLDAYRDARDKLEEQMFFGFYGSPFVRRFSASTWTASCGRSPETSPEKLAARQAQTDAYAAMVETGGFDEALTRAVLYVLAADRMLDQRCALALNVARQQTHATVACRVQDTGAGPVLRPPARAERAIEVLPSLVPERGRAEDTTGAGARDRRRGRPSDRGRGRPLARLSQVLAVPIEKPAASAPPADNQAAGIRKTDAVLH